MRRIVVLPVLVCAMVAIAGTGTASAHVPFCTESVNPHGQNVRRGQHDAAGSQRGAERGRLLQIGSDVGLAVTVVTGGVTFGPFASGSVIKYAGPGSRTHVEDDRIEHRAGRRGDRAHHRTG